ALHVTGFQTCALPICAGPGRAPPARPPHERRVAVTLDMDSRPVTLARLGSDRGVNVDRTGLAHHSPFTPAGATSAPEGEVEPGKIGRASCRERGTAGL